MGWATIDDILQKASVANSSRYGYSLRIKKLYRVRPSELLSRYEAEAVKLGASTQLFYGARLKRDVAQTIAAGGFQLPNKPGPFGRGIHVAPCPLLCASLAPETSWMPLAKRIVTKPWTALKKENGYIFLCDVFLGSYTTLLRKNCEFDPAEYLKGGWLRESLGLGNYDSVYAPGFFFGAVSVDEYVVYREEQALPRYLLEFEYVYAGSQPAASPSVP